MCGVVELPDHHCGDELVLFTILVCHILICFTYLFTEIANQQNLLLHQEQLPDYLIEVFYQSAVSCIHSYVHVLSVSL